MLGLIVAMTRDGVIGLDGRIPWHYPADLARFRRLTMGATVIMGRRTWESLPRRPLPGRRSLVLTSRPLPGVETAATLTEALMMVVGDAWVIGGAQVYAEALPLVDRIEVTYVPDVVRDGPGVVRCPPLGAMARGRWRTEVINLPGGLSCVSMRRVAPSAA